MAAPRPPVADASLTSIVKDHILRSYEKKDSTTEPWRSLPEIPSSEEILRSYEHGDLEDEHRQVPDGPQGLPVNFIDRPWRDTASYIGAHYQLLREDAVYPLRRAVAQVKADPTMGDNRDTVIYTHVHIVGITFARRGAALKVEFSYENAGKRIRWEQSNRLQSGTIVALTPRHDMFNTICKVAVVAARPLKNGVDLNPPRVDLFWGDSDEAEFDPSTNWVMVESRSGYWESFRHMGVALQKLRSETFPLSKYLVEIEKTIDAPSYVKQNPYADMSSLVPNAPTDEMEGDPEFENVSITENWPDIPCNLDASQLEATKRILTKQVAIIQGPPGTGKTFVSITSLKIMLDNWVPGDPPIIISAQTNHALDQLLLLIQPHAPSFIRLGSRTSDNTGVIKKRTLFFVRSTQPNGLINNSNHPVGALKSIQQQILSNLTHLVHDQALTGLNLLDQKLITQEQYDSLHDPNWAMAPTDGTEPLTDILAWVGPEQTLKLQSRCPPINASFEEEELEDEFEQLNEDEAESRKLNAEEEFNELGGEFFELKQTWSGERAPVSQRAIKKLLKETSDLWDIDDVHRGEIYCYFLDQVKKVRVQKFREDCKIYEKCSANLKIARWADDAKMILKLKTKVIGCTTTGLSKYRGLLAALKPRTLLIEEAAETVEGTVLAAMFESLDQLVLVGDHQQLQAKCNRPDLEKQPYNLAISMFERLVNNGLEYTMLNKQRRMIPEIRKTFTHVYPHLNDHDSVHDRIINRPPVPGMGTDCFWFHHKWPENKIDTSRCNYDEAAMIVKFFDHLVLNAVDRSKITILTFYNGQKKVLLKMLKKHPNLKDSTYFNVFTVDSYQGEENDIILLSLVRSNDDQICGFLANRNRAVVSLSRARRGLYVFGNAFNVISRPGDAAFGVWGPILDTFHGNKTISEYLPLTCVNHNSTIMVKEPDDWDIMGLTGGCRMKCKGKLPCGHACPHNCHPFDHEQLICKEACPKILDCGHQCNEVCGENFCDCGQCSTTLEEPEPYVPDVQTNGWEAPAGWRQSLGRVIVREPRIPRQSSRLPSSGVSSNVHSPNESRQVVGSEGRGGNSYTRHDWAAWNAREADQELQQQREAVEESKANNPSGTRTPVIVDDYRPVTVASGERSGRGRSAKKEFTAPALTSTSTQSAIVSGIAIYETSQPLGATGDDHLPSNGLATPPAEALQYEEEEDDIYGVSPDRKRSSTKRSYSFIKSVTSASDQEYANAHGRGTLSLVVGNTRRGQESASPPPNLLDDDYGHDTVINRQAVQAPLTPAVENHMGYEEEEEDLLIFD